MIARVAVEVLQEPGGLVTAGPLTSVRWAEDLLKRRLAVTSGPAAGMSYLLMELVLHVIASGRQVRILDYGGSFRNLCTSLDGHYLDHWQPNLWRDPNLTFIVMDLEGLSRESWSVVLDDIHLTPSGMWLLAAESWVYNNECPRANLLSSSYFPGGNGQQVQADVVLFGVDRRNTKPLILSDDDFDFLLHGGSPQLKASRWVLVDGQSHHRLLMTASPKRLELFR